MNVSIKRISKAQYPQVPAADPYHLQAASPERAAVNLRGSQIEDGCYSTSTLSNFLLLDKKIKIMKKDPVEKTPGL